MLCLLRGSSVAKWCRRQARHAGVFGVKQHEQAFDQHIRQFTQVRPVPDRCCAVIVTEFGTQSSIFYVEELQLHERPPFVRVGAWNVSRRLGWRRARVAAERSAVRADIGCQRARGEGNGQRQADARIVQIDVE
jgi:hypothetical protein